VYIPIQIYLHTLSILLLVPHTSIVNFALAIKDEESLILGLSPNSLAKVHAITVLFDERQREGNTVFIVERMQYLINGLR
jgi:hypothetical protein